MFRCRARAGNTDCDTNRQMHVYACRYNFAHTHYFVHSICLCVYNEAQRIIHHGVHAPIKACPCVHTLAMASILLLQMRREIGQGSNFVGHITNIIGRNDAHAHHLLGENLKFEYEDGTKILMCKDYSDR